MEPARHVRMGFLKLFLATRTGRAGIVMIHGLTLGDGLGEGHAPIVALPSELQETTQGSVIVKDPG